MSSGAAGAGPGEVPTVLARHTGAQVRHGQRCSALPHQASPSGCVSLALSSGTPQVCWVPPRGGPPVTMGQGRSPTRQSPMDPCEELGPCMAITHTR